MHVINIDRIFRKKIQQITIVRSFTRKKFFYGLKYIYCILAYRIILYKQLLRRYILVFKYKTFVCFSVFKISDDFTPKIRMQSTLMDRKILCIMKEKRR